MDKVWKGMGRNQEEMMISAQKSLGGRYKEEAEEKAGIRERFAL